jgi:hypothetical protein
MMPILLCSASSPPPPPGDCFEAGGVACELQLGGGEDGESSAPQRGSRERERQVGGYVGVSGGGAGMC